MTQSTGTDAPVLAEDSAAERDTPVVPATTSQPSQGDATDLPRMDIDGVPHTIVGTIAVSDQVRNPR